MYDVPAWCVTLGAFVAAALLLLRLRHERRRGVEVALFPALVWLGMVYLFVHLGLFNLSDPSQRGGAVRPALLLLLLVLAAADVAALWRLRRLKS